MGKNKFENFVFSVMVCFLMVTGMTLYNNAIHFSEKWNVLNTLFSISFVFIFIVAFIIDWFFVAPVVKKIVNALTNENTSFIIRVLFISNLMVLFMCAAMSLIATMLQGYEGNLLMAYGRTFLLNLVFALSLQFFLVGPIARTTFFKVFPLPSVATSN